MRKAAIVITMFLALVFIWLAIKEEQPYMEEKQKSKDLKKKCVSATSDVDETEPLREIDFQALHELNPDIVAWIYIPGTPIDYPVLKNPVHNFYLTHDFTGVQSDLGSIFMQHTTNSNFQDQHTILYGHNLVDKQMFGSLSNYASQEERNAQPYIYIYLPEQVLACEIYAAYECMDGTETYQLTFANETAFTEWKDFTVQSSFYQSKIPNIDDQILTLSTCTDNGQARFVVHAIIAEYGERK